MTAAVVEGLSSAAVAAVTGGADGATGDAGNLEGRKVTHWSFWVVAGGAVVAAIVAIAGVILGLAEISGMYALAALGGVMFVTNGLGAFFVKRFSTLAAFKDYSEDLARKVDTLSKEADGLKKVNKELQSLNKDLKDIPKEYEQAIEDGKQKIGKKNDEIKKLSENLSAVEVELQMVGEAVVMGIRQQTEKFSQVVSQIEGGNVQVDDKLKRMRELLLELGEQNEDLAKYSKSFNEQVGQSDVLNSAFAKQVEMLEDLLQVIRKMGLQVNEGMKELDQQNDELTNDIENADKATHTLDEVSEKYEELIKQFDKLIEKVKAYKEYKNRCKKLETENATLKARLEGSEQVNIGDE